ncbi:MAG TPA: co-chaperone GroES [Kiritimatiellia bacterium]|nr:co-chaperone GroES [Kiritimatiellia bacterium]HMO98110.1 co-chaperone GroES [Kiritimatiellia bacterium]HMP97173.1 co-chaperone GroES [Kiritimatiellia bacterium]
MKIQPLADRVLVEPLKESEVNKGGIIIPDTAKEKPQQGTVIAVGTGKLDEKGNKIPFNVKKGDKVLMPKYGGTEIKLDGKEYQIMREEDILGIID